jgi:aminopeptidase-like protein
LADSLEKCQAAIAILEGDRVYVNQNPKCEPRLGKRGLYRGMGGEKDGGINEMALLWILNLADGSHSLLDIADRAKVPFAVIRRAADALVDCGLLVERRF